MLGYWLSRVDGIFATGKNPYAFDKLARGLNRRGTNNHTRQFFVPQFQCTEDFKAKNIPVEEEVDSDVLDQLASNVDFNQSGEDSLNRELKQARKQKILQQTKLIGQKLQQRKKLLFSQWSERFFDSFANHFGKMKNVLVEMHLNEEQVKVFNQTLQKCLQNMQLDLNNIQSDFMQERQDEAKES